MFVPVIRVSDRAAVRGRVDVWMASGPTRAGRGFGFTPPELRASVKGWHQGGAVVKHPFWEHSCWTAAELKPTSLPAI